VRVAFIITRIDTGWIGGANYLTNLLASIAALPDRQFETVLIVPPDGADMARRFAADEVVVTPLMKHRGLLRMAGVACQRLLGSNPVVAWLARRHGIDVFSHTVPFGPRSPLKTICWIPDFQHVHLPDLFSPQERGARDRSDARFVREGSVVLLSSGDAQGDLIRLYPEAEAKSRVLQFVSGLASQAPLRPLEELARDYALTGPYFHLPNQLWKHKNHRLVVEALALLAREGLAPTVICTGHTKDFRHPGFADELSAYARELNVADRFRICGLVPYADVASLMHHSVAVINPSLFEGWSTTVEEAKSTGKRILLSDIAVHREQDPPRASFFATQDPASLAAAMRQALADHDPQGEIAHTNAAEAMLATRIEGFARNFQTIVLEAAQK
jgi:glycosyltransferase involved in cell wall biosynthesis